LYKFSDPIRGKEVALTPEERVRQALLRHMLGSLSFPKGLIAVEKKIGPSKRRFDIVAYRNEGNGLIPLLLIECKASCDDEEKAFRQAVGYRAGILAPFWCLAHAKGIRTFWLEENTVRTVPFLPSYPQLLLSLYD
jgi:hypothetical protein